MQLVDITRSFFVEFQEWCNSADRSPMILQGQRQVGKSYFMKYESTKAINEKSVIHIIDFVKDQKAHSLFELISNIDELIERIEIYLHTKINIDDDILFFDEIQECAKAISSLKYFKEDLPKLRVVAAGSYLGIMANQESFPVGKVIFKNIAPLSFEEFLQIYSTDLFKIYKKIDVDSEDPIATIYHEKFLEVFHLYLVLGGMPAVVFSYFKNGLLNKVEALEVAREIQKNILLSYQSDFSKYAGMINATQILNVFESTASQLSKAYDETVSRFKFSGVIPGARNFQKIAGPLTWLEKTRLVIKTKICHQAKIPLKAYVKENIFKLYYCDVGLLQAALDIPISKAYSLKLGEYKGYIVENFIATQLFLKTFDSLYSWSEGESEVEFLIYRNGEIAPIEVKSSANYSRAKSLKFFIDRYSPNESFKLSPLNKGKNHSLKMMTLPVYLINKL